MNLLIIIVWKYIFRRGVQLLQLKLINLANNLSSGSPWVIFLQFTGETLQCSFDMYIQVFLLPRLQLAVSILFYYYHFLFEYALFSCVSIIYMLRTNEHLCVLFQSCQPCYIKFVLYIYICCWPLLFGKLKQLLRLPFEP